MVDIHPTAVVAPGARLGTGVKIGPYSVIGPHVEIGDGAKLWSHVVIDGYTKVGARCEIYPFASVGLPPQDRKYRGESSHLEIGEETQIREYVTTNPGTEGGGMVTRIGRRCLLMGSSHVAHDCQIGDDVILVNGVLLAGHVVVGDGAILGGAAAVLQFVRIGRKAMIGGASTVVQDVIPYGLVMGERARLDGLNLVGLRRAELPREQVDGLRQAYEQLFAGAGVLEERAQELDDLGQDNPLVADVLEFIRARSKHGILQPGTGHGD